jgi:hypothetical protein
MTYNTLLTIDPPGSHPIWVCLPGSRPVCCATFMLYSSAVRAE